MSEQPGRRESTASSHHKTGAWLQRWAGGGGRRAERAAGPEHNTVYQAWRAVRLHPQGIGSHRGYSAGGALLSRNPTEPCVQKTAEREGAVATGRGDGAAEAGGGADASPVCSGHGKARGWLVSAGVGRWPWEDSGAGKGSGIAGGDLVLRHTADTVRSHGRWAPGAIRRPYVLVAWT